jgi:hypothetical protein
MAELMIRFTAALGATLFAATTVLAANGANDYLLSVTPQLQASN